MKKNIKILFKMCILFLMILCLLPITYANENEFEVYKSSEELDGYKDLLYVNDNGEKIVVYCFNAHKNWPDSIRPTKMTKKENVSADVFYENISYIYKAQRYGNNKEELKESILRVMYSGFPKNATGIKEKYNLTNGQFCMITQAAVWYYTDGLKLDKTQFWNSYSNWFNKKDIKDAYNELINSKTSLPDDYELDLYLFNPSSIANIQNVLSSRLTKDYKPEKIEKQEKIEKSVKKEWSDNNDQDKIRPEEVKVQLYANNEKVYIKINI